jgi:hypothetical protein
MIPRAARPERHVRLALFLEAAPGAPVAALAHHWREGGDTERAFDYLLQTAEEANRGWTRERAIALYDQALESLPPSREARRHEIGQRRAVAFAAWMHIVMLDVGHRRPAEVSPG